jgi:general secretion pathway protein E
MVNRNSPTEPSGPANADAAWLRRQAAALGMPFLEVIADDMLDPELTRGVPVEWARAHGMLPVRWEGRLWVLTSDPSAVTQQEDLALLVGEELAPAVATPAEIARGIERCYATRRESPERFLQTFDAAAVGGPEAGPARSDDLLQVAEAAPVTQLLNLILLEAVNSRASDIHLEPFEAALGVRYRVDGVLYEQAAPPKALERALVSRVKVMAHLDIAERRLPQDGVARVRVGEREIDIRVSTVPVAEGERVVLRLLDRESSLLPLTALGMPEAMRRTFEGLLQETHGLLVVCGPTGSGKTTTLYAAIRQTDTIGRNVLTIEDPVEYQLPRIGQMQVKPKIGLTFARGLRHILRQDPDVILVGETRDAETAEIAIRAALTGHVVLTTLHTNDAPEAVIRMMDMGAEPYLLAAALRAVLAQRLVRRLCPECRQPAEPSADERAALGPAAARLDGRTVWGPRGCPRCLGGYRGRLGLFELLPVNAEMQDVIRRGETAAGRLRACAGGRMASLRDDGVEMALAGETSLAEIVHAVGAAAGAGA